MELVEPTKICLMGFSIYGTGVRKKTLLLRSQLQPDLFCDVCQLQPDLFCDVSSNFIFNGQHITRVAFVRFSPQVLVRSSFYQLSRDLPIIRKV